MNENIGDGLLKFATGIFKGLATATVTTEYVHELKDDFEQHPAESLGEHVGHAVGGTLKAIIFPFSNDQN
jgi:hypothetical protein